MQFVNRPNDYPGGYSVNGVNAAPVRSSQAFTKYLARTYLWMFFGLALSFGVAFYIYSMGESVTAFVYRNFALYMGAVVAEIVLIVVLSIFVMRIPPVAAKALFLCYSTVFGVSLAPILMAYDLGSIIYVLAITAVMFLMLAFSGLVLKRDLSKMGTVLFVALLGLIVYTIISLFLFRSPINQTIIGLAGILIFMGFTMYDSNRIKKFYYNFNGSNEILEKMSIVSALQLYLDFVNLFLYLLRFFGSRRD